MPTVSCPFALIIKNYFNEHKAYFNLNCKEVYRLQEDINIKYTRSIVVQIEENTVFPRVVAHWNALPESVIDVTSVNSFKNRLNNHWKNIEIKFVPDFYGPEARISRNDNVMDLRGQS